jgi:hypothetical protein
VAAGDGPEGGLHRRLHPHDRSHRRRLSGRARPLRPGQLSTLSLDAVAEAVQEGDKQARSGGWASPRVAARQLTASRCPFFHQFMRNIVQELHPRLRDRDGPRQDSAHAVFRTAGITIENDECTPTPSPDARARQRR